jgi:hypothetical protein
MFDAARAVDRQKFWTWQHTAGAEFAASSVQFRVAVTEGAFLRTQGYSVIPDRFLRLDAINIFVTTVLGYDVDRDRTGGACIGPRASRPGIGGDSFYKIFLGLDHATVRTLPHEYAHHLTLDTAEKPTLPGNFWTDLRNDHWLWRQRGGTAIAEFRRCAAAPFARGV